MTAPGRPAPAPVTAYVGLGSNLDGPVCQIRAGLRELARLPQTTLAATSTLYVNAPMGPADQPDYVNAVARLHTALAPLALLDALLDAERRRGRRRGRRWGERRLDLDLLLWGNSRLNLPGLKVPHPGLHERAFVLYPLAELDPALRVPGFGAISKLCEGVESTGLRPVDEAAES